MGLGRSCFCVYFAYRPAFVSAFSSSKQKVPTTAKARDYLAKQKTRGSWRKRSEGLNPEHVKPSKQAKHRRNTGGRTSVLAGVTGHKVTVWEYLPKRWRGAVAAQMYKGVIKKALKKHRPGKSRHKIMEGLPVLGNFHGDI